MENLLKNPEVTEIQVVPIKPVNGLVGFASFVLDQSWYFSSIGIFSRPNGSFRLTYPSKKIGSKSIQIFHPIDKEVGQFIEKVVIKKFEEVTNNYARYSSHYSE